MDSQEGIDQVCIIDYFDRTKIDGDINRQSQIGYQLGTCAGINFIRVARYYGGGFYYSSRVKMTSLKNRKEHLRRIPT